MARGDYFSPRARWASGLPLLPPPLLDMLVGKDEGPEGALPVFCGMHALLALQSAGLIAHYPAEMCGASDLHALATRFLQAVPDANPFPRTEDTDVAGFPISREVAAQGIV